MSKPLGHKSYGSIPNLPGGQLGRGDYRIHEGQARILTEKTRDKHDTIIVQEKLDGSNVAIANVDGRILAITRAGHLATTSRYEQHQLFAHWVRERESKFAVMLSPGERLCGEWLAQAHGTRYNLDGDRVFAAFDIMREHERLPYKEFTSRVAGRVFRVPTLAWQGQAVPLEDALEELGTYGHYGAADPVEGLVYRCERNGKVEFLAKYVRPDFVPGRYIPQFTGHEEVWNWRPTAQPA